MDEGGDEHPAQAFCGERVLIGVNAVATEDLDLYVCPGQLQHPVTKVELGEDEEGMAQPLKDVLADLQEKRTEDVGLLEKREGKK